MSIRLSLFGGTMLPNAYTTVGHKKKAPVGKSETLLFIITSGILNEVFAFFLHKKTLTSTAQLLMPCVGKNKPRPPRLLVRRDI